MSPVPFYADDTTTLYLGDADTILPAITSGTVHLVATDPPYFRVVDAEWDDQWGPDVNAFLDWLTTILGHCDRTLADRGTIGVFCSPDLAAGVEMRMRERFGILNHIVWRKPGPGRLGTMDKSTMRRFFPTSERIILGEKARNPDGDLMRFRDHVNHQVARDVYADVREQLVAWRDAAGLTNRDVDKALGKNGMAGHYFGASQWALPNAEAWEVLRPMFLERGVDVPEFDALRGEFDARRREFDARRREFDARRREFDARRREFDARRGEFDARRREFELMSDVWTFDPVPAAHRIASHPTQKPLGLMSHIIETTTRPGDVVLDPFAGTGTTLRAAKDLGRHSIGIERDERYCEAIAKRLAQEVLFA